MRECVVCKTRYQKGNGVTFHKFPCDKKRLELWLKNIEKPDWCPKKYDFLCSKHFSDDCFIKHNSCTTLKKCSLPTIFCSSEALPRLIPNEVPTLMPWNYSSDDETSLVLKKNNSQMCYATNFTNKEDILQKEYTLCQKDVKQSAAQRKSSTEQVHIKVEPDTHYEDPPSIHNTSIEPIAHVKIEPGTYDEDSPDVRERQMLEIEVEKKPVIKEEPMLHHEVIIDENEQDNALPTVTAAPTQEDQLRDYPLLTSAERTIIANVYKFLSEEYDMMKANNKSHCDLTPLANIRKRTAEATGVNELVVSNILNEGNQTPATSNNLLTPLKKRRKNKMLVVVLPKDLRQRIKLKAKSLSDCAPRSVLKRVQ